MANAEKYVLLDQRHAFGDPMWCQCCLILLFRYYKVAVGAYPTHSTVIVKYANLLKSVKKDYDQAEQLYKQAIQANPRHAESLGSYAVLLHGTRQKHDVRRAMQGRVALFPSRTV